MSTSLAAASTDINKLLEPFLFQVIGSTPDSIRDSILQSDLRGKNKAGMLLATVALFAAAVNKATMETFVARPELQEARPFISSTFSISGKTNMTSLSLLGHCILTSEIVNEIEFCKAFRVKLGQNDLWSGDLKSGNLSEKQRGILQQKKSVTPATTAKLLGSGFFKYVGVDPGYFTSEEAVFWKVTNVRAEPVRATAPAPAPAARPEAPVPAGSITPPRSEARIENTTFTLSDGSVVPIPKEVADYYLFINNNDRARIVRSIESNGVSNFVSRYRQAMNDDPARRRGQGGTVV